MKHISAFAVFLASFIILSSMVGIGIFMNWNAPDFKNSRTLVVSIYSSSFGAVLLAMIYVGIKKPFEKKLVKN